MRNALHRLAHFAGHFVAGVDAGHAVRHGLPGAPRVLTREGCREAG